MDDKLKELEQKIGYTFRDSDLLKTAMMHSSYTNEQHMPKHRCNERLEFLGDAVLELVSSEFLFRRSPKMPDWGAIFILEKERNPRAEGTGILLLLTQWKH